MCELLTIAAALRVRRRAVELRHRLVNLLPGRLQAALPSRAVPWTERFTVLLPDGDSVQLASGRSHRLLARLCWQGAASYEPATARTWWCLSQDAATVADVGAYVGYYALLASKAAPHAAVLACEPLAESARHIRAFAASNSADRVQVHEAALGAKTGESAFYLPLAPANPLPTVGTTLAPADIERQEDGEHVCRSVRMLTLDSLFAARDRRLDLMKLDVEGSELEVLLGGEDTIAASGTDIVMEVTPGASRSLDALCWLVDHGFAIYDLTPEGPISVALASLKHLSNTRESRRHRYGEVLASKRPAHDMELLRRRVAALQWP